MPRTVSRHKIAFEVAIYRSCKLTLTLTVLFVRCLIQLIYMWDFTVRLVEIAGIVHWWIQKRWLSKSTKMTLVGTMSFVRKPFGRQTIWQQILEILFGQNEEVICKSYVCWPNVCWPSVCWPNICQPNVCEQSVQQISVEQNVCQPNVCWPNICQPNVSQPNVSQPKCLSAKMSVSQNVCCHVSVDQMSGDQVSVDQMSVN